VNITLFKKPNKTCYFLYLSSFYFPDFKYGIRFLVVISSRYMFNLYNSNVKIKLVSRIIR